MTGGWRAKFGMVLVVNAVVGVWAVLLGLAADWDLNWTMIGVCAWVILLLMVVGTWVDRKIPPGGKVN